MNIKYIRPCSDLHTEFKPCKLPELETDSESILILAGDIGSETTAVEFVNSISNRFPYVVYVLGNHEYYGKNLKHVKNNIKSNIIGDNVFVIDEPETIVFSENLKIVAGTLWTDFNQNNKQTHDNVGTFLNDFRYIYNGDFKFTTYDAYNIFKRTIEFFEKEVDENTIVVTHHMPSEFCVAPAYKTRFHDNGGFRSDLDYLIVRKNPRYWIHGHGHNSVNFKLGETHIIANPRGYPLHFGEMENGVFDDELVIEL